jgi:hypothetical protein
MESTKPTPPAGEEKYSGDPKGLVIKTIKGSRKI